MLGNDARRTRVANAYFSLFMAVGNILGYATGSYSGCIVSANEVPLSSSAAAHAGEGAGESSGTEEAFMWELFGTFKYFSMPIWIVLSVTALTWVGWFPFTLFDTDWMGREIYGGDPNGGLVYDSGVRMGALGLLLNSVVLGITSLLMERLCRKRGAGFLWGLSNISMTICFISMLVLTYAAKSIGYVEKGLPPPTGIVIAALAIFTILGFPLAITYSVPYALISTHIEPLGLGQGLSMGVLNLAIVVPQIIVSLGSGPWDQLFGGGNSPAFAVAAVAALLSGLLALLAIPRTGTQKTRSRV
ncbi:unnamed protein product [Vicia faba]|uniref:Sucrose transport protein SUC4 n=1 Tax=Vicia faba TaxID=3906 RepID=A0AAV0YB59_VICFA|nr:unnamed protein product [Vicia faba]